MSSGAVNSVTSNEQVIKILEQEKFYGDKNTVLMLLVLLLALLIVSLGGLVVLLRNAAFPLPTYFQATSESQLLREAPLDQPNIEENVLLNWITEGMMMAHTFNFMNYGAEITDANTYFLPEGYENYKTALTTSKIVEQVVGQKLVLKAVPTDAPQVLLAEALAGRYLWKIQIPMRFRYQSITTDVSDLVLVSLIVMRVPTTQSPHGILILKYALEMQGRR